MRYVFYTFTLVGFVVAAIYASSIAPSVNIAATLPSKAQVLPTADKTLEPLMEAPSVLERSSQKGGATGDKILVEVIDSAVVNIGPPMDPDDPSSWAEAESTELVNIGPPMDPDDPSTWPQLVDGAVVNIGEPMDPDDPSTWSRSEAKVPINIGELMDPDDPSTWSQPSNTGVINIGEYIDPDNP